MITRNLRVSTEQQPPEPGELRGGELQVQLKFVRLIGAGGMGQVWEAVSDDLPGQRFAVKVVAAEHAKDPSIVSRFFGEARAAGAIDDPNIVMVYGTGRTNDGRPALVMPYIEGQSLADMCDERGPLPLDAVGKAMLQLASALRAAHSASIVHRDIKPQNVMVMARRWGREWFAILVDFGICKFHDVALAGDIHTITKQYLGTPGYSAPEQILGKPITAKTDIYALGVLAYRILCGRLPFVGDSNIEVITRQCDPRASFPEPRVLRRDIPREWNDLISLCLERDPTRRPTAPEFGRWIAAGMQNGASMLTSLAPQIAAETQTSAGAETISSDVPTALAQIHAQTRRRGNRRAHVASLAAAAFLGAISTAFAFQLAGANHGPPETGVTERSTGSGREAAAQARPTTATATDTKHVGSAQPMPPSGTSTATASGAPPAGQAAASSPPEPQTRAAANVAASGAHDRAGTSPATRSPSAADIPAIKPSPGAATAELARSAPGAAPDEPRSRTSGPTGGPAFEPVRSKRTTGTLEIRAKTWADCFLADGGQEVSIGTAPITVTDLPVGRHRVRCRNDSQRKDETVTVMIDATKIAVIEKSW